MVDEMDSMMMLCYMYAFCKFEPLSNAISNNATEEDSWIGLLGGRQLSIAESNIFLKKYMTEVSND